MQVTLAQLTDFARRYTAAWCSHNPATVASFFAENGSLQINDAAPAVGRNAISAAAQSFMITFPDLLVVMDDVRIDGRRGIYRWTLTGTISGAGKTVRISGYEEWTFDSNGLIAESKGHFDQRDYDRQMNAST